MKRLVAGAVFIFWISISSVFGSIHENDTTRLIPKPVYGKEAQAIVYILDNNHYRRIQLNDSLSSAILDAYMEGLDNNRSYFLASDVSEFEAFRFKIDDFTHNQDVSVAYDIFHVYAKRFNDRMDFVLDSLITHPFDYSVNEFLETDRSKLPWATSEAELNEAWRKIIKGQSLSLKLAGKEQAEIERTLRTRYERFKKSISQFNSEDIFSIYMNAITEAYDPHTNYFSPKAADQFKQSMSLSLEGIGARLQTDGDYTKIVEVLPGGPAEKSNKLQANDRIIGVAQGDDGEMVDIIGWRVDDAVKLIKGPKGTKVRLQYLPAETGLNGPSREITLVRDKIKLEDQQATKNTINYRQDGKDLKLGVITLPSFYMDFEEYQKGNKDYKSTTRDVKRLINELKAENVNGIVMDLRNNGGGSLSEAIDLTGLFIKNGPVVQVKNSMNKIEVGNDDDNSVLYNGPLVVLTNRFSASASEIFAGAIQDYNRGVVVGESTFGKGTVQTVVDLKQFLNNPNEEVGQLKITFQKFYRVTGSSTQHKGVTPDVLLPSALDPEQFGESSNPSALPWDEIRSTLYTKTPVINNRIIADLNKSYQNRTKTDAELDRFIIETEETKKRINETTVSLNEKTRRIEMEEAERRKSTNDKMGTKLGNQETKDISDLSELRDEYLREGLLVLGDLITSKIG